MTDRSQENRAHADAMGGCQIPVHRISHHCGLMRGSSECLERCVENRRIRFEGALARRVNDRIEQPAHPGLGDDCVEVAVPVRYDAEPEMRFQPREDLLAAPEARSGFLEKRFADALDTLEALARIHLAERFAKSIGPLAAKILELISHQEANQVAELETFPRFAS